MSKFKIGDMVKIKGHEHLGEFEVVSVYVNGRYELDDSGCGMEVFGEMLEKTIKKYTFDEAKKLVEADHNKRFKDEYDNYIDWCRHKVRISWDSPTFSNVIAVHLSDEWFEVE